MKLKTIVWREIFERKNQLATSFFAIVLGITAIVAIQNVTHYSEMAVARELDALGTNILILPKSVTLQDYYGADMQGEVLPEEYVDTLTNSGLEGVDNLSPKLTTPVDIGGKRFTLTGILPKSEFQAKAAWQGAGVFARPIGCGKVDVPGSQAPPPTKEGLVRKRVIETLSDSEALIGAEVQATLKLNEGDKLELLGKSFTISAVLPQTGTVDDSRIFAHLHTVQQLTGKGSVVNAIEVVGCCEMISKGLVKKINALLPDAKVVTITQVVDTQVKTNQMMSKLSLVFLGIIVLVGGASIANYMYANVFERRREIGTLMAMGAGSGVVVRMFLLKALLLGLVGGVAGYILGTIAAVTLGPRDAGVPVLPMLWLAPVAIGVAVSISLGASYFPARRAARLDPCAALQET
jgi:putative ABC transport system permease protein